MKLIDAKWKYVVLYEEFDRGLTTVRLKVFESDKDAARCGAATRGARVFELGTEYGASAMIYALPPARQKKNLFGKGVRDGNG